MAADASGSGGGTRDRLVFLGLDILDDEPDENADEHNHYHPIDDADRDTFVAYCNPGGTEDAVID